MAFMTKTRKPAGISDDPAEGGAPREGGTDALSGRDTSVAVGDITAEMTEAAKNAPQKTGLKKLLAKLRRNEHALSGGFDAYPHLMALRPKEGYLFRSDYFTVDDGVAAILAFFHDETSTDSYPAFWGIDRMPDGLDDEITTVIFEQVERRDDKWVQAFIRQSEQLDRMDQAEQQQVDSKSARRKAQKVSGDLEVVISEIQNGAAYLSVHNRMLVKANSLESLEEALEKISRLYVERFGSLKAAPYAGEQRGELSNLWRINDKKRGKGFGFTSTEFAGSYSLVTNGISDPAGSYVGYLVGDINSSAVLLDVNRYSRRVVIADSTVSSRLNREYVADMWCSKLSQAALLHNRSVVHIVLDGANLDHLGPKFERLTSRVDMTKGDVNMFEMFGEREDQLATFASQMEKLTLMFEQVFHSSDHDRSIIRGELQKTATQFYVDQGMWYRNAPENIDRLRVVGIPHDQVPRLDMFVSYLDQQHRALLTSNARDDEALHAYGVLRVAARNMLDNNPDLFNNFTAGSIDGVRDARRVIYDFSSLLRRGTGIAMAQLVNIVSFAVGKLSLGDTVIIHGAENIDPGVKNFIENQLKFLYQRGGRVVYSYNDVEAMLADKDFNRFDDADYTLLGSMRDSTAETYREKLGRSIPADLLRLITVRDEELTYLRRGTTNVVFRTDLPLGINPNRAAQRAARAEEARRAELAEAARATLFDATEMKTYAGGVGDQPATAPAPKLRRSPGPRKLGRP